MKKMVTKNKNFDYAIWLLDVCRIAKLACMHNKTFYTEFTFYGKLTLHEIAEFICDIDGKTDDLSDVFRMEKLLEEESDYVYEEYQGKPCTTIFID